MRIASLTPGVAYDPLRDSRHRSAKSARDQADWLAWLELGGRAPRTLADYEWATARGMRMFPDKGLVDFTDGDLVHVLRTFPPKGRRNKKAAYDSWFRWALLTDRIDRNPMVMIPAALREGQKVIDVFTDAEIAALTGLPDNDGDLFLILFDAGLRRSEARRLSVRDCQLDEAQFVILNAKGRKDRLVPMTTRLVQRLSKWFLLDAMQPNEYLWPTRPGGYYLRRSKPIGETSFRTWYTRRLDDAGVRYRNPHTTRHTFATRWLRRGGRLATLSRCMGHSSIRVTADLYAHLDVTDLAADLAIVEGV